MSTGAGNPGTQRGQIIEALDNLTWSKGKHAFKFGADFKRLSDHDDNVFGNYRSGWYVFDGSSSVGTAIGDPYTAFLLGYPDWTQVSTTNNDVMNGLGYSYAIYAQDDWKVTPNLTLNLGLRYELHPPLKETDSNTAAFMPDWSGTGADGSTAVNGAVVVSNTSALKNVSQDLLAAIAPTPILTAQQVGIPSALRYTDYSDVGPRIGFSWRPFGKDKTVLRGGWGGSSMAAGVFTGVGLGGGAELRGNVHPGFPGRRRDAVVELWRSVQLDGSEFVWDGGILLRVSDSLSRSESSAVEPDAGAGSWAQHWDAALVSGSRGSDLEAMVDLNQVQPNTVGYDVAQDSRPYPAWSIVQSVTNLAKSNYNSGTVDVSRHSGKGVTFDASYTWTRDLSNAAGLAPNAFAVAGGSYLTTRFDPGLDYGNVMFDRRHRFLTTGLYDLPFGKGQKWLTSGGAMNGFVGGWELAGVVVLQSGPFLTPYQQSVDPANTNILTTVGQARPDQVQNVPVYAQQRTTTQWLNAAAFPYEESADSGWDWDRAVRERARGRRGGARDGKLLAIDAEERGDDGEGKAGA